MASVSEGSLTFEFPSHYQVIGYDKTDWYDSLKKLQGVKGLDILAYDQQTHWWIEVKDCYGFESENMVRLTPSDQVYATMNWIREKGWEDSVRVIENKKEYYVDDLILKLMGTVGGLVFAARNGNAELNPFLGAVAGCAQINLILFLGWNHRSFEVHAMRLRRQLENKISRLGVNLKCFIMNENSTKPSGLECVVTRSS